VLNDIRFLLDFFKIFSTSFLTIVEYTQELDTRLNEVRLHIKKTIHKAVPEIIILPSFHKNEKGN